MFQAADDAVESSVSSLSREDAQSPGSKTESGGASRLVREFLLVSGGALVLATLILGFVIPLSAGRMEKPSADLISRLAHWRFLLEHRPDFLGEGMPVAILIILAGGLGFAACALAIRLTWNASGRRDLWAVVICVALLSSFLNIWSLPNLNTNIYNYILRGRVAAAHGENPYAVPAGAFPEDPFRPYANPKYIERAGGKLPAWMVINIALARLGGDDVARTLLVYRAGLFLISGANIALIAFIGRRLIRRRALSGLALWAWNPIVIMNGQSRTDPAMVFWLLLGIALLVWGRRRLAVIPMTLSVFVKILTLPLLATAALAEMRSRRWRELGIALLIVIATTVGIWLPFVSGVDLNLLQKYYMVADEAGKGGGGGVVNLILRFGFAALILGVGLTRRGDDLGLLRGWALVQLYFSIFFAKFASADYLMTLMAIVAVTMDWRVLMVSFVLGGASFMFDEWYRVGSSAFRLPDLLPGTATLVFAVSLVLAAALVVLFAARRRLVARFAGRGAGDRVGS